MIIGFSGRAGVGKTTIAELFIQQRYGPWVKRAFADPLKESLMTLTGLPRKHFFDIEFKEQVIDYIGKSPRELMQLFGTEFVREMVHPDFWVLRMREQLRIDMRTGHHIAVDDIRFENEAQLIRDMGGIVVHLHREFDCPTTRVDHKSEKPVKAQKEDIGIASSKETTPEATCLMIYDALSLFHKELN